MREIGGYIELDRYTLPKLHKDAFALNCGRNAFAYLLRAREINKIMIPTSIVLRKHAEDDIRNGGVFVSLNKYRL